MIDYLERLFTVQPEEWEEKTVLSVQKAAVEEEKVIPVPKRIPAEEPEVRNPTKTISDVESIRTDALRRIEHALSVEEGVRESLTIRRPAPSDAGEELERRLRRDSRRYDSGFFWY